MNLATWITTPHIQHIEIARLHGFSDVVLDVEHGSFDLASLDNAMALLKALGMRAHAKVLAPTVEAVQQALDFGADSVIVPHVEGTEHARAVCNGAKYPPLGTRSYAAGRSMAFNRQDDAFFPETNARIRCWPMCETAGALEEIDEILALPTVDGIFMGPSDLSLSRGRPNYSFADGDREDIARVAAACGKAGKEWVMPGWTPPEREFARGLDPAPTMMVVGPQLAIVHAGFAQLRGQLEGEGLC